MTTARPDWNPIREPRDKILLGGHASPGVCEIVGASSPRNYEERVGPGLSGAIVVFRGIRPSHFSVKFRLVGETDWSDWNAFQRIVYRPPIGKRPRPLDIVHPLLAGVGIAAVVIEDVIAPVQVDDGIWEAELKLIETRKLKRALSKPQGGQDTPIDPIDAELEAETARNQQLRDQLAAP